MARRFFYVCAGLLMLGLTFTLGAQSGTAQSSGSTETAALSGIIADGQVIPLPRYGDGSEALEAECRWIVSAKDVTGNDWAPQAVRCFTEGRTVRAHYCKQSDCMGPGKTPITANYLIIAVRSTVPVEVSKFKAE